MRILWWKRDHDAGTPQDRHVQAVQAFRDSETELMSAAVQAQEANRLADSLRSLRDQNHFGMRMRIGIQEGLRHE